MRGDSNAGDQHCGRPEKSSASGGGAADHVESWQCSAQVSDMTFWEA